MGQANKIVIAIAICFSLLTSLQKGWSFKEDCLCASVPGSEFEQVKKLIEEHPELLWLADQNVQKTQEGRETLNGSYSEKLFHIKCPEFDRSLLSLFCLRWILDGSDSSYEAFTTIQPEDVKLSRKSFKEIHEEAKALVNSHWQGLKPQEIILCIETGLVLGDMGKSPTARDIFKPYGASAPDQDDFYAEAIAVLMQHPSLSPSFQKLPSNGRELLRKIAGLAHYGHISHLEGGYPMFSTLKKSKIVSEDLTAFRIDFLIHLCDVAGAAGHIHHASSLSYNEWTYKGKQAVYQSILTLADNEKSEEDAYNTYLKIRADWLGLDMKNPFHRILARFGAMLRFFTPEEGIALKQAFDSLEPNEKEKILAQFSVENKQQTFPTDTYGPALLLNLMNHPQLGNTLEERLRQTMHLGARFMAEVLEERIKQVERHEYNPKNPLNFNPVAGTAKTSPFLLEEGIFTIDPSGKVFVQEKKEEKPSVSAASL